MRRLYHMDVGGIPRVGASHMNMLILLQVICCGHTGVEGNFSTYSVQVDV
jgi:hypothetical protein